MKLGITATRNGLTMAQLADLYDVIDLADEIHHGDCVGGDAQAHQLALNAGRNIVIHPPDNDSLRAYCWGSRATVLDPLPYLARDWNIVNAVDMLWAGPDGPRRGRSGTWWTADHAVSVGKPARICLPDGTVSSVGDVVIVQRPDGTLTTATFERRGDA